MPSFQKKISSVSKKISSLNLASCVYSNHFSFCLPLKSCLSKQELKTFESKINFLRKTFGSYCELNSDRIQLAVEQHRTHSVLSQNVSQLCCDFTIQLQLGSFIIFKQRLRDVTNLSDAAYNISKLPLDFLRYLWSFVDSYENFLWENYPASRGPY